jgi:glycerol-3-phosphate acyltransferase PlsX
MAAASGNPTKETLVLMKIIVDVMGGDSPCTTLAQGALHAATAYGVEILLVGDEQALEPVLKNAPASVSVWNAPSFVTMEDDHYAVRTTKADSSMVQALRLLAEGKGDAVVSAGNTGALITAATLYVKRIRGVRRAALAPILPTTTGTGALLIDCGANVECTPEYLLQFGIIGHFYAQKLMHKEIPSVGLLNVGTEDTKGDSLRLAAFDLLKKADEQGILRFIGNIEGRDVLSGQVDVIVADGFSGNVLLKSIEGTALFFLQEVKTALLSSYRSKLGALLAKKSLSKLKEKMNYRKVGGSPLVGIAAPVIKAHGSADAETMQSAIAQAIAYAKGEIISAIEQNIAAIKTTD